MAVMKAPSFKGLKPASAAASASKRQNRNSDTVHERLLRQLLWRRGLRFRKNLTQLPGKPDIVFTKARVVVFCDGDFWHGRNWRRLARQLQNRANADYWYKKIRSNMLRDRWTTQFLEKQGWYVVRIWEGDVLADSEQAAARIEMIVRKSQGG
jgi:DNA mismatch endonuclease (patch repair protein)